ncbi:MAG TPA: signal peptidase II [Thermoanaerobaculia bacterium]|jgi:signal peptidase II
MKKYLPLSLVLLVLLCCVGCDQAVKAIAKGALASSPPVLLLDGAVRLQYTENPGAFLSLGADLPAGVRFLLGVVLVGATQLALLAFLLRTRALSTWQRIGFSLFLAGGLGNWIDRLLNEGRVIDFVSLGVGRLHTGIFNVADVAITAGILMVLVAGRQLAAQGDGTPFPGGGD